MINEVSIPIDGLKTYLKSEISEDVWPLCMYATEPEDSTGKIHTILRKGNEITHITSELETKFYNSISDELPFFRHYERELQEMSGIEVIGLNDYGPLKLMNPYKGGYPLQKSDLPTERYNVPIKENGVSGDGVFEVPVGPVHAGVIEPGHFRFSVAGEHILKVHSHLGYTHRNVERLLETFVLKDSSRMIERIVGDSAVSSSLAYVHAIEGETEIPYRARILRVIYAELERIAVYLGDIGGMAQDTGFSVCAVTAAGMREKSLRLNRIISGHRFLMGTVCLGGVRIDISDDSIEEIRNRMMKITFDLEKLMEMMDSAQMFTDRTETTGILTKDVGIRYRATGPVARAAGIKTDIRKDRPYDAYSELGFKVITESKGDVAARLHVKSREVIESISLITQCLDKLESGELKTTIPKFYEGFRIGLVESPRGELMHAINVSDGKIWRYKIRDPSFVNWTVLERVLPGNIIPDFPLINKSFNLSYSGNDL